MLAFALDLELGGADVELAGQVRADGGGAALGEDLVVLLGAAGVGVADDDHLLVAGLGQAEHGAHAVQVGAGLGQDLARIVAELDLEAEQIGGARRARPDIGGDGGVGLDASGWPESARGAEGSARSGLIRMLRVAPIGACPRFFSGHRIRARSAACGAGPLKITVSSARAEAVPASRPARKLRLTIQRVAVIVSLLT